MTTKNREVWYDVIYFNDNGEEITDSAKTKRKAIEIGKARAAEGVTFYVERHCVRTTEHLGARK